MSIPTIATPGVRFEAAPAAPDRTLPRMDVAAFVGLAPSGPLDVPVAVEDMAGYTTVFGARQPLAQDPESGRTDTAHLAAAVEGFFANGGRRAWVVRVAGVGHTHRIPVPGLVAGDGTDPTTWSLATVRSRCQGSWSDPQRAGARRETAALDLSGASIGGGDGARTVVVRGATDAATGDLVEIEYATGATETVAVTGADPGPDGTTRLTGRTAVWTVPAGPGELPVAEAAVLGDLDGHPVDVRRLVLDPTGGCTVTVDPAAAPDLGATLLLRTPVGWVVTVVTSARADGDRHVLHGSPTRVLPLDAPDRQAQGALTRLTRVRIGLAEWQEGVLVGTVPGLAPGGPDGPHWWGHLPTDEELFGRDLAVVRAASSPGERARLGPLDARVADPRFGLAADDAVPLVLPLGLADVHDLARSAGPLPTGGDALTRDGLADLGVDVFADPAVRDLGVSALADELRRRAAGSTPLRGLHALAPVEEVSLIAVPDAAHPGWRRETPPAPGFLRAPELVAEPPARVRWTAPDPAPGFRLALSADPTFAAPHATVTSADRKTDLPDTGCGRVFARVRAEDGDRVSGWSNTVALRHPATAVSPCDDPVPPAPMLTLDGGLLSWSGPAEGRYEVEWSDQPGLPAPRRTRVVGTGLPAEPGPGATWFRVRELAGAGPVPWSNTVAVPGQPTPRWVARDAVGVSVTSVAVHHALLTLCAARADAVAVLSLPLHYGHAETARHRESFAASGRFDEHALSFGALYHPWLETREPEGREAALMPRPPDGAVVGAVARRTLDRAAWVAPANLALSAALGTRAAPGGADGQRLRSLTINVVAARPGGALVTTADTLTSIDALRPLSVRRLLLLLRRLALREGSLNLFEPNDTDLRRILRTRFEALLTGMFRSGAFAGRTPDEAFRVATGAGVDPPDATSTGRVGIDLAVAPSRPLEFITVRLVRTGAGGLVAEEAS